MNIDKYIEKAHMILEKFNHPKNPHVEFEINRTIITRIKGLSELSDTFRQRKQILALKNVFDNLNLFVE